MIIFWTNFGGGPAQGALQFLPLLIFLIPLITSLIFGDSDSTSYVYDHRFGWQRQRAPGSSLEASSRREIPTSIWAQSITLISFIISMVIGFFAVRQAWRRHQQQQALVGRRRGPQHRSHSERIAATAQLIQKLPIQVHHTKEELSSKSISQLKAILLEEREEIDDDDDGGENFVNLIRKHDQFLEKQDLVEAILGPVTSRSQDSSAESCSICCEDYACGDLKRVLPQCAHQFHVECIDRWFLSSTDYSRPVSCPMCNTELKEEE